MSWRSLPEEIRVQVVEFLVLTAELTTVNKWFAKVAPVILTRQLTLNNRTHHLDLPLFTRLGSLTIVDGGVGEVVSRLTTLTCLNIKWSAFSGSSCGSLTNLTSLNIAKYQGIFDRTLTKLVNLRTLSMKLNDTVTGVSVSKLTALEHLNLSNNYNIYGQHLRTLTNITTLVVHHYSNVNTADLEALPKLTTLDAGHSEININRLQYLTSLTRLDISWHPHVMSDNISTLTNLTWLDVRKSWGIIDINMRRLQVLKTSTQGVILVSDKCRVTHTSWPYWYCDARTIKVRPSPASWLHIPNVVNLTVCLPDVYVVNSVSTITRLVSLRTLKISSDKGVGDRGVDEALMARLRDLKIGHRLKAFTYKGHPGATLDDTYGNPLPQVKPKK